MMTTGTDTRYTIEKFEAGDIDPARAKELVQRYFGSLPKRPRPPRISFLGASD